MRFHVFVGANGALLFAAEKNESDGAAGKQPSGFDGSRSFNNQRRIAAVVERAGSEFPGIQMPAEYHRFVRFFIAANLTNNILLLDRAADFVGYLEVRTDFPGIRG